MANILNSKHFSENSFFLPENLWREARRQKGINDCSVPRICLLDPDGDIMRYLRKNGAQVNGCWACYHSDLYNGRYKDLEFGIIGCAVGASYAVLLAEQLFVSGCELLISITCTGKINESVKSDYLLISDAIRDEGTSNHYLPDNEESFLDADLLKKLFALESNKSVSVKVAKSWTTDAPYRETQSAISHAKVLGADSAEMEASALYGFAQVRSKPDVCYAHLTNSMAQQNGDFENGSLTSLELGYQTVKQRGRL